MVEQLKNKLKCLEKEKNTKSRERNQMLQRNPEVKKFVRLGFEERKLDLEISKLKEKIEETTMLNCSHAFVNIDSKGTRYCVKCGISNEITTSENNFKIRTIYQNTKRNSKNIEIDYACDKKVIEAIIKVLKIKYLSITDEELVHFFAAAIHNMQVKEKSKEVKKGRAKRLYVRPIFLERSNML